MNLLLDTNVLSEVRRPAPDPKVLAWLDTIDEDRAFISVASIAELKRGIALMNDGRRRDALSAWLAEDLRARFAGVLEEGRKIETVEGTPQGGGSCRSIRRSPNAGAI
jgi:predicted nucleic acid-binding protein